MHRAFRVVALLLMTSPAYGAIAIPVAAQGQVLAVADRAPRFYLASVGSRVLKDASNVAALRRRVSLTLDRVSLADALEAISTKAELRLVYSRDLLPPRATVSLKAEGITVTAALTEVLFDSGLDVIISSAGQMTLVRRDAGKALRGGAIVGRVAEAGTMRGLPGTEILLDGTSWRAVTDTAGRYRLSDVEPGAYTLTVRRVGYTKWHHGVTVVAEREDTVDVTLEPKAVALSELVTTATGPQRRRDIGNAITTIKADSVLRTAPIRNLADLLKNRVPGMTLQHTSGAPGDPARIRLRGIGSVMRSNDPVVFVDGIRVYAAQSAARSGNLTNACSTSGDYGPGRGLQCVNSDTLPAPSPLDQIDPNVIEKIEVLKGPSAATLYGADAANGVIVITTKRGKPGPTRWDGSFAYGMTKTLGRYPTGYYRWGHDPSVGLAAFCPITMVWCVQDSLVQFQALNLASLTVLGRGHRAALSLTASGGTQALTYSVTGSYNNEIGLLKLPAFEVERFRSTFNRQAPDWMRRPHELTDWHVQSNVSARIGATADVTLSASLGREQQQRTSLESQVAPLAGTYIDSINKVYYQATTLTGGTTPGIAPSTSILQNYYDRTTASSITFTTGLDANWHPRSWLTANGRAGVNVIERNDQKLLPPGLASLTDSGAVSRATGQSLVGTFSVRGAVRRSLGRGLMFATNLGADLNTEHSADIGATASGLVPGTATLGGATKIAAFDAQTSNSVFGWYLEPQITGQRLSLSTGLRLDGGSAYGTRVSGLGGGLLGGLLPLPKLNGSWVISEESWFPLKSLFSSLRLRGGYGQAQVQPRSEDRLRLYQYSTAADPSVELSTLGNTQLRPERSTELEAGFDADLLDSRVSLEFTTYRKTKIDALMPLTLPVSVNGGGSVLTNVGTIRNTGVDATLRLTPVRSPALTWTNELTLSSNRNELVELGSGVLPNRTAGLVAGYPVGGRWDKPILGYSDISGDGVLQPREILVGDSAVFMGQLYPTYTTMLHTGATLFNGAVSITGGFSYDAGATQVDQTARTNWVLSRALADPSTPLNQQAAALMANYDTYTLQHTDYGVIQKISTFRFQTFAVNYRAPASVARLLGAQQLTVALQGDNLALHSTYRGKDPDVTAWAPGEGIADSGQLAQPTTWQLQLHLNY